MRVFALILLIAVSANAAGLRRGSDDETPMDIRNEKEAETDAGCDGVQCGHVPKMVARGHFAHNVYLGKIADMNETFHPALVSPGTFNQTLHKLLQEPLKKPLLEKPNMVPSGHFASVLRTQADLKARMGKKDLPSQQAGTCKILDKVVTMARFVYEVESSTSDGIDKSGQAIAKLMDLMCPLVKSHYPAATEGMDCAKLADSVKKFYDPVFVGQTKTLKQRCANAPGHKVNFALLAALVGPKTLFGATFCEDRHDALKCMAKTITELVPVQNKTVDEQVREDAKIEEIAEKKVLSDERGNGWSKEQATKIKTDEPEEADNLGEAKDAGKIHRCRNCKHKTAKLRELGYDIPGDKPYDLHNEENVHNVVTDAEKSGINKPRGPSEVHSIEK